MSRSLGQTLSVPLIGQPIIQPFRMYAPSRQTPAMVPIFIDWKLYNNTGAISAIGVNVNLSTAAAGNPTTIDKIASVSIDNTGSNVPVYVYFPDTQFVITCGPGGTIIENAVTSGNVAVIYGVGFTGGAQPTTLVCFYNSVLQPVTSGETQYVQPQYFASTINANVPNNTAYRPLALGDLCLTQSMSITYSGAPTQSGSSQSWVWPSGFSQLGCYAYITGIFAQIGGAVDYHSVTTTVTTGTLGFWDTLGDINLTFSYANEIVTNTFTPLNVQLISMQNLQLKSRCDAGNPFSIGYKSGNALYYNNSSNYLDNVTLTVTLFCTLRNENTL